MIAVLLCAVVPAVVRDSTLFSTETADSQLVWMSHGDEAVKLPEGFTVVARSEQVGGTSMPSCGPPVRAVSV